MGDQNSGGVLTRVSTWAAHPFQSDMSAVQWVLFFGLVIIAAFLWTRVLAHITE